MAVTPATAVAAQTSQGAGVAPVPHTVTVPVGTPLLPRVEKLHVGQFNGQQVRYRSVFEERAIVGEQGAQIASIGAVSYIREGRDPQRPVIFAFNGGPGAGAIWLHMGILGSMRMDYGPAAGEEELTLPTVAPFAITDNPEAPLDVADVVLIDPPGTGYSRIHGAANFDQIAGPDNDAAAVAQYITAWRRAHGREQSPAYLVGESYGTVRAALVAEQLTRDTDGRPKRVDGVLLLGQIIDGTRNSVEMSSITGVATYAATAWYHGKVDKTLSLSAHVERARRFAYGPYLQALFAGSRQTAQQRAGTAQELSALIGIPAARLLELDLRVDPTTFGKEILRDEGLQVGAYDARFTLPLAASGGDPVADDPAMGQYVPMYIAGLQMHFERNLGLKVNRSYNAIEFQRVLFPFWKGQTPLSGNYAASLALAQQRNPALRVLVATGYFDLVTTLGMADQTVALSDLDPARVTMVEYTSGHMAYIGKDSRARMAEDLRAFVTGVTGSVH